MELQIELDDDDKDDLKTNINVEKLKEYKVYYIENTVKKGTSENKNKIESDFLKEINSVIQKYTQTEPITMKIDSFDDINSSNFTGENLIKIKLQGVESKELKTKNISLDRYTENNEVQNIKNVIAFKHDQKFYKRFECSNALHLIHFMVEFVYMKLAHDFYETKDLKIMTVPEPTVEFIKINMNNNVQVCYAFLVTEDVVKQGFKTFLQGNDESIKYYKTKSTKINKENRSPTKRNKNSSPTKNSPKKKRKTVKPSIYGPPKLSDEWNTYYKSTDTSLTKPRNNTSNSDLESQITSPRRKQKIYNAMHDNLIELNNYGIYHNDVNPGNVFIKITCKEPKQGKRYEYEFKLIDFGHASTIQETGTQLNSLKKYNEKNVNATDFDKWVEGYNKHYEEYNEFNTIESFGGKRLNKKDKSKKKKTRKRKARKGRKSKRGYKSKK